MMKKQNKKRGFTIVELVIVVTVIAILSAVLIPTFAGVIKRSKMSADQQATRNMNMALVGAEIADLEDAIDVLDEAGYNAEDTLVPVSKNHAFYWDNANKTVVLVNTKNNTVVYPENYKASFSDDWADLKNDGYKYVDITASNEDVLTKALKAGNEKITLGTDIVVKDSITVAQNANITLDLNGYNLDASKNESRPFSIDSNATLVINAEGAEISNGRNGLVNVAGEGVVANVTINGGTFTANDKLDNGAFLRVRDGASANITLNNVTYIDNVDDESFVLNFSSSNGVNLTVNGGTFEAAFGFQASQVTASDATITTDGYAFMIEAATESTITNTTITGGDAIDASGSLYGIITATNGATINADNCDITINGNAVAYFVANTGGEIVATNAKGALTAGSTDYVEEGATIKITVNGEEKVNK